MTSPRLTAAETAALTRRVTLLSVATAAVLVTIKFAAWLASGSTALLASMADSGLDLVASLITFFVVRYAASPPDEEHRFGHGKAEAFVKTLVNGWAYARPYDSSGERAAHLGRFLTRYNHYRPHGGIGGLPPITRVPAGNNVCGKNS